MPRRPSPTVKKKPLIQPLAVGAYKKGALLLARRESPGGFELVITGSPDGKKFSPRFTTVVIKLPKSKLEDLARCQDFRLSGDGDNPVLTYLRQTKTGSELVYAGTRDRKLWLAGGAIKNIDRPGFFLPAAGAQKNDILYYGGAELRTAYSSNLRGWKIVPTGAPEPSFLDDKDLSVVGAVPQGDDLVVLYAGHLKSDILADNNLYDQKIGEEHFLKLGAAIFPSDKPYKLKWQTDLPLCEIALSDAGEISIIGFLPFGKKEKVWRVYTTTPNGHFSFFDLPVGVVARQYLRPVFQLQKHPNNPLLEPTNHYWERDGAFNPTALDLDGRVHLLYRAVGIGGNSFVGYASAEDGVTIDKRLIHPVYVPREGFENGAGAKHGTDAGLFASGGSWGGCEDPKVTLIDDRIYMTYVAHNGTWPMRTALTSISLADFRAHRWNWSQPMIMSAPNVGSKSVVILPEKINDEYVIFHRLWPNIIIDKVKELDFGPGKRWLRTKFKIPPRPSYWDSQKLSVGAAPIKTKAGWLVIYNAVDRRDSSRYKIGAMLLELKQPEKVIARSAHPILSPDEWYENEGKPGIAYPGGAIERDGILYVYYGGGDKVSCVATIPIDELIQNILADKELRPEIHPI
jgi:predicted GH43/DUF377 family glycosyl hydrolase